MRQDNRGESGNVLWFILLAIALLAALTITITHFSDTTHQTGNREMARVQASQILRTAKGWQEAINQMQGREVSANDIDFDDPGLSGYANPNCTSDACKLFKPGGGGQTYAPPDTGWLDASQAARPSYGQWIFTGKLCVQGVGDVTEAIGGNCAANGSAADDELTVLLPYVTMSVCQELNTLLGLAGPGATPPMNTDNPLAATRFTGVFADGVNIVAGNAQLYQRPAGCLQNAGGGIAQTYTFYDVLIAR